MTLGKMKKSFDLVEFYKIYDENIRAVHLHLHGVWVPGIIANFRKVRFPSTGNLIVYYPVMCVYIRIMYLERILYNPISVFKVLCLRSKAINVYFL